MSSIASNDSRNAVYSASSDGLEPAAAGVRDSASGRLLAEAREYCRRLARSHYENFSVATLVPAGTSAPAFFNVYAYCRISDDLGDEVGDPEASLQLLDEWETELDACYAGNPRHPVFVALGGNGAPVRHSQASLLPIC